MATQRQTQPTRPNGAQAPREESTRDLILRAAATAFARQGFRAATVDDVAAEAGMSKGAVYWHFDSKEELLLTLLEEHVDSFLEGVIEASHGAAPERLAPQASGGLAELLERRRESLLLLNEFWSLAARDPKMRRHFLRRQRRLRKALTRLMSEQGEQGPPLTLPAEQLATAVLGLGIGLGMVHLTDPKAAPPQLFAEVLSLIYDGNAARVEAGT